MTVACVASTDEDLARRGSAGDRDARHRLAERWTPRLLAFAASLIGSRHAAEDVVQDVLLVILSRLDRFDPARGPFATWIFTVARNRCRRERRAVGRRARRQDGAPVPPPAPTAADAAGRAELFAALDRAVLALPLRQRAAFVLAEIQGLALAEVAAIESVPVGTVKSRLARARTAIRAALQARGEGPP